MRGFPKAVKGIRDWGLLHARIALSDAFVSVSVNPGAQLDEREEAVRRFYELLERDPDDSQFARYWLARGLLDLERHGELLDLVEQFDDDSAMWL